MADSLRGAGYSVCSPHDGWIAGVTIDTRRRCEDSLFVALKGSRSDGHDYLAEAVERGAAALLVSEDREEEATALSGEKPVFAVPDPLLALQALAASYRKLVNPRVMAVTGSTGKTGTKDFIASILSLRFGVHATPGNLNNHIGLPLTLLGMEGAEEVLVTEMGANHKNEIRRLAEISKPDMGVITNIGPGHLEFFGSLQGVAEAKAELLESLPPAGSAVLPADDEFFAFLSGKTRASVVSFGFHEDSDWRIENLVKKGQWGCSFSTKGIEIALGRLGRHHVLNAAAAAAACSLIGATSEEIARGIEIAKIPDGRGVLYDIEGILFVDDSYNSNPASLRAAVEAFMEIETDGARWLVLGDMLELGEKSAEFHREAGILCGKAGVDVIVTFGSETVELSRSAAEQRKAPARISHFIDAEKLSVFLNEHLSPGDIALIKGSRAMQMENIIESVERLRSAHRRRVG